jgi:hypothetical protein
MSYKPSDLLHQAIQDSIDIFDSLISMSENVVSATEEAIITFHTIINNYRKTVPLSEFMVIKDDIQVVFEEVIKKYRIQIPPVSDYPLIKIIEDDIKIAFEDAFKKYFPKEWEDLNLYNEAPFVSTIVEESINRRRN